jgi:hypothetical protein
LECASPLALWISDKKRYKNGQFKSGGGPPQSKEPDGSKKYVASITKSEIVLFDFSTE